ncbi:MAG: hypothetical protein AAFX76_06065, partial [Planctomycetota bacterium]
MTRLAHHFLSAALLAAVAAPLHAGPRYLPGQDVRFTAQTADGRTLDSADLGGRLVAVMFW